MRCTSLALSTFLLLAAACGGGTAPLPDGPITAGVITGNHQVVPAAPLAPLPQQVGVQVIRLPNGTMTTLRLLDRVGDALLPPMLFAQTVVNGVPNQAVCQAASRPGERALHADIPCAISDANGKAYLTFLHDSIAGTPIARVGVSTPTGTQITDSVTATVLAGAADPNYYTQSPPITPLPAVVPVTSVQDKYGNAIPFRIVAVGGLVVQDTTTGSVGARTIVSGPEASTGPGGAGFIVELRGANNVLLGRGRYVIHAPNLNGWLAAGVNLTP